MENITNAHPSEKTIIVKDSKLSRFLFKAEGKGKEVRKTQGQNSTQTNVRNQARKKKKEKSQKRVAQKKRFLNRIEKYSAQPLVEEKEFSPGGRTPPIK